MSHVVSAHTEQFPVFRRELPPTAAVSPQPSRGITTQLLLGIDAHGVLRCRGRITRPAPSSTDDRSPLPAAVLDGSICLRCRDSLEAAHRIRVGNGRLCVYRCHDTHACDMRLRAAWPAEWISARTATTRVTGSGDASVTPASSPPCKAIDCGSLPSQPADARSKQATSCESTIDLRRPRPRNYDPAPEELPTVA